MELVVVYDIIIDEIDTPIAISDAQNLSETICVSLFELKFCFDEFGHHIEYNKISSWFTYNTNKIKFV